MGAEFDLLPKNWKEQAKELDEETAKSIKEQNPGVYDYTCPMNEVPTMAILLNEKGKRRVFLLRNPVCAG